LLGFCATQLPAQTNALAPRLTGIVSLSGTNFAWLKASNRHGLYPHYIAYSLCPGERDGEMELVKIEPEQGMVLCLYYGTNFLLRLGNMGFVEDRTVRLSPISVRSYQAGWSEVIRLYEFWTHRSALYPENLNGLKFTMNLRATNDIEAVRLIEDAFRKQGVLSVLDGSKFVQLTLSNQIPYIKFASTTAKTNSARAQAQEEELPLGVIELRGLDARTLGEIYAKFSGLEFTNRGQLGPKTACVGFYFHQEVPLTRKEVLHAIEALFRLEALSVERVGDTGFRLVDVH
jgi:hypothetical protein